MTTVTISLPESLREFLNRQVASKGYGNVSEYFRTLLRDAREKDRNHRLEELLLEGLNSGQDIPLDRRFWKDLRAQAVRMVAEPKATAGRKKRR